MEFQEAVMKIMVHKTEAEKSLLERNQKGRVNGNSNQTKHKWKISFYRSSSSSSTSKQRLQNRQQQQKPGHVPVTEPPKEFLCPISGSLMEDPVIVSSGHTFERVCVQACKTLGFIPTLFDATTSPDFSTVIPNLALKSTIINWCINHSLDQPTPLDSMSAMKLVHTLMDSRVQNPNTQREKEKAEVSVSEKLLIDNMKDSPSAKFNHATTELSRHRSKFYSMSSDDSFISSSPPLQLTTRPSCYSSSSSAEIITSSPNSDEDDIVTKLKSSQVNEIEEALISLRKITKTREETRVQYCTTSILSALRSLITSRYTAIQVNSAAALVNLSLEKVNKVKMVRSGIVPPLIDVLKGGSPEAQEHASGAIFSLALDDSNKTAIGVLGALQPLMHLLRSGTERTRHDSALALYHLSLVQSNRSKLVKLGCVSVLLNMVKSGQMQSRVLLTLCNLASCSGSGGRAALLDSGGVECFVGMLRDEKLDGSTRESCVAILYGLSHGGLRFKGLAMAAQAAEVLRTVERTGSERAKEKASKMLEAMKDKSLEAEEQVDWEELLDSGFRSHTWDRTGRGMNSAEF